MCGIVGILGQTPVAGTIYEALKRLEYRGYDSSGIATLENGQIKRLRARGKLVNLESCLRETTLAGTAGIGHTRWATHGAPSVTNAHPHVCDSVAVVHNGIIENFRELREELEEQGCRFESETDTETVAQLIAMAMKAGKSPVEAVREMLGKVRGAFALGILFSGEEDFLIGARNGPPLAVGYGKGEMYLGSDAIALAPLTNSLSYLEDGDWVVVRRSGVQFFDQDHKEVTRPVIQTSQSAIHADKGNYRHFMAKEIFEQPEVISHTLAKYINPMDGKISIPDLDLDWCALDRVTISACGTAYIAGLVGKYWLEEMARINVDIDVASEFRYRKAPLSENALALFISQSGETADTLAGLRYCRASGLKIAAVVNVPESTIARESDFVLPTRAGVEVGVASTKAFTCQLAVMACLAMDAGRARGILDETRLKAMLRSLESLPGLIHELLQQDQQIEAIAKSLTKSGNILYLGRGTSFPIALEGALKLKEISYIHAEGYAAGELKHGPIALVDEEMPVIVVAPDDRLYEKTLSNLQEVAARGGKIILISNAMRLEQNAKDIWAGIAIPDADPFINPILATLPVQLLAYHTAVHMGTDVDQPRNLAKSVTVE